MLWIYDASMSIAKYQSPDGNYALIIKSKRSMFSSTMPGDGGLGSTSIEVILTNAKGKVIGKSSSDTNCETLYLSIDVNWNIENDEVWFTKNKFIHLKTGKPSC